MKRFLLSILSFLCALSVHAGKWRATEMTMVDTFKLSLGAELPILEASRVYYGGTRFPWLLVDGAWKLYSGFIDSKHFGQNGGVDLGFQVRFKRMNYLIDGSYYYDDGEYGSNTMKLEDLNTVFVVRSAFHYQFLKRLDTYTGLLGGLNFIFRAGERPKNMEPDTAVETYVCFGYYAGVAVYITPFLGLGAELHQDLMEDYYNGRIMSGKLFLKF